MRSYDVILIIRLPLGQKGRRTIYDRTVPIPAPTPLPRFDSPKYGGRRRARGTWRHSLDWFPQCSIPVETIDRIHPCSHIFPHRLILRRSIQNFNLRQFGGTKRRNLDGFDGECQIYSFSLVRGGGACGGTHDCRIGSKTSFTHRTLQFVHWILAHHKCCEVKLRNVCSIHSFLCWSHRSTFFEEMDLWAKMQVIQLRESDR